MADGQPVYVCVCWGLTVLVIKTHKNIIVDLLVVQRATFHPSFSYFNDLTITSL